MIFSKNRRKIEPHRRFGSREFRHRLKQQAIGSRRVFTETRSAAMVGWLKIFSFRRKSMRVLGVGLLLVAIYYLAISERFLISEVALAGNKTVEHQQVEDTLQTLGNSRVLLVKKNHYLLMTKGRVEKMLTEAIPDIKEVISSDRQGLNKIAIEIRERNPGFVFVAKGRKFLVDEDGNVLKELQEKMDLPEVVDQVEEDVVVGELLPNPKMIAFIQSMHKAWPAKINSPITSIKVPGKGSSEAQFASAEGWSVFFDVNRSVLSQLSNLTVVLAKQVPLADRGRLAYVDMRSEKWVYYCFKATACESEPANN